MLDVLVTAVMRLMHAALGPMVERGQRRRSSTSRAWPSFLPARLLLGGQGLREQARASGRRPSTRPHGVTVTTLCPGFVRTEFHERMDVSQDSAPDFLWLDADDLVRTALADLAKGKVLSIPSARYKVITGAARLVPRRPAPALPGASAGSSALRPRRAPRVRRPAPQRRARSSSRSSCSGAVV